MGKVGLSAVAAAAGVSEATVSRVVNKPSLVAGATRRRVEAAMREVGFRRGASSDVVLLITPGVESTYFGRLTDLLTAALAVHGMRAVSCSAPIGSVQELGFVTAMAEAGVVGAVFVSASNTVIGADPAVHRDLESRGIPFVCINGAFEGTTAPTFSSDDRRAAELSVEHLWALGHRRIGMIAGPEGDRPSTLRADGFQEAMRRRGAAAADALVTRHEYSFEGGFAGATALLENSAVTALIGANDEMALGAARAARRRGLDVPGDVSIVGYDDAMALDYCDPPLTTVRQPIDRIALALVPVLTRLVRDGSGPAGEVLFEPTLVIRASTAPAS